ncbi:hypothetical protein FQZ97_1053310 [compost metagenome]
MNDFLVWYARDKTRVKFRPCYLPKSQEPDGIYKYVQFPDGNERTLSSAEIESCPPLPDGAKIFSLDNITSPRPAGDGDLREYSFNGTRFPLTKGTFKTDLKGLRKLDAAGRLGKVCTTPAETRVDS